MYKTNSSATDRTMLATLYQNYASYTLPELECLFHCWRFFKWYASRGFVL